MNILKLFLDFRKTKKYTPPLIYTKEETIDLIISKKLSVCRFGDGEFDLILNINHPKFQNSNSKLRDKLIHTLKNKNKNLLKCIPKVFEYHDLYIYKFKPMKHWLKFVMKNRMEIYKHLQKEYYYGDALFTRNYMSLKNKTECSHYFSKIMQIWNNRKVIIIEGRFTRFGVNNDLLKNANSVKRILCPEKNAFDQYDKILDCALTQPKDVLFLIALGPTATVLSSDLSDKGYQAIDIGHLDIEYEWFLSGTNKKSKIQNKYVNETDDIITDNNDTLKDDLYESQIIERIS